MWSVIDFISVHAWCVPNDHFRYSANPKYFISTDMFHERVAKKFDYRPQTNTETQYRGEGQPSLPKNNAEKGVLLNCGKFHTERVGARLKHRLPDLIGGEDNIHFSAGSGNYHSCTAVRGE